ncbi:MAG: hypothetical protein HY291_21285 [Planctomycetes bacterium]|nr:hypothetical protein [Planctomycetota bacterium]
MPKRLVPWLKYLPIAFMATVMLVACTITEEGVQEVEIKTDEIFPPSKTVASFRQIDKPKRVDVDALAAQLGGKPKLELVKKWSTLTTMACDYGIPGQPAAVRVSVTEMTSKVSAYGAYTNLRPGLLPEKAYVKIGTQGVIDGSRLIFMHDHYLVCVLALQNFTEEQLRSLLVNFGRAITARIARPITEIEPVGFLPLEYRVPASERLDKEDPLGLGIFDQGAITALYRNEGREGKVFIAQIEETLGRRGHYAKLVKVLEKNGKTKELTLADNALVGKLFNSPCIVAQRDKAVFGVYGTLTEDEMREVMMGIDRRIRPYVPPNMKDIKKKEEEREKEKEKDAQKKGE